jgi:hypothetical protein
MIVAPGFFTPPSCGECIGPHDICDFDLSWTEVAGQLTAVNLNVDGFTNSGDFFLDRALIGSDDRYPGFGCTLVACEVTGFWTNVPAPVPEPMSVVLLITGLLGVCLALRSRGAAPD